MIFMQKLAIGRIPKAQESATAPGPEMGRWQQQLCGEAFLPTAYC